MAHSTGHIRKASPDAGESKEGGYLPDDNVSERDISL